LENPLTMCLQLRFDHEVSPTDFQNQIRGFGSCCFRPFDWSNYQLQEYCTKSSLSARSIYSVSHSTNDDWTVNFELDWVSKSIIQEHSIAEETESQLLFALSHSRQVTTGLFSAWPLTRQIHRCSWPEMFLLAYDLPKLGARSSNLNPSLTSPQV